MSLGPERVSVGRAQAGTQAKDSGLRSNWVDKQNASSSRCPQYISFSRSPVLHTMEMSQLFPTGRGRGQLRLCLDSRESALTEDGSTGEKHCFLRWSGRHTALRSTRNLGLGSEYDRRSHRVQQFAHRASVRPGIWIVADRNRTAVERCTWYPKNCWTPVGRSQCLGRDLRQNHQSRTCHSRQVAHARRRTLANHWRVYLRHQ